MACGLQALFSRNRKNMKGAEKDIVRPMQAAKDTERRPEIATDVCFALPASWPCHARNVCIETSSGYLIIVCMRRSAVGAPAARAAARAAAPARARARRRALRGRHLPAGAETLANGLRAQHKRTLRGHFRQMPKYLCGGLPALSRWLRSALAAVPGSAAQQKRFASTGAIVDRGAMWGLTG